MEKNILRCGRGVTNLTEKEIKKKIIQLIESSPYLKKQLIRILKDSFEKNKK